MKNVLLDNNHLFRENIIGVKVVTEKRSYKQTLGSPIEKEIQRTKYLKICWMCGSPYESNKFNSTACSPRCAQKINYVRKKGLNPPARMEQLTKEKYVKEIKEKFGY